MVVRSGRYSSPLLGAARANRNVRFRTVEKRSRYLLFVDPLELVAALQAVYKLLLLPRVVLVVSTLEAQNPQTLVYQQSIRLTMAPIKTFALLALGALVERAVCVPQAEGVIGLLFMRPPWGHR